MSVEAAERNLAELLAFVKQSGASDLYLSAGAQVMMRLHGDVVPLRMGPQRMWIVTDPDLIGEVFVGQVDAFKKDIGLRRVKVLLGDGLLSTEGKEHARRSKLAQPAFRKQEVDRFADGMVRTTTERARRWAERGTVELDEELSQLALSIVAQSLFGAALTDEAAVGHALTAVLRLLEERLHAFLPLPLWIPTAHNRRFSAARAVLDGAVMDIVRQRRAAQGDGRIDLLSRLMGATADGERSLSDRELRDEVMTLVLAGHETTANALAWAWHLVARNPAVETRLRAEARAVLGDRLPTMSDLPSLPYALCVLKESMRLYPPAYFIGRRALVDTTVAGFEVAKGRTVFINVWGLHRDARLFPDPEAFRPERFLDGAEKTWIKGSYMPFGGGPRICVGNHFALMEGQMILAQTAARFGLSVPAGTPMPMAEPLITLRLATPCDMIVGR